MVIKPSLTVYMQACIIQLMKLKQLIAISLNGEMNNYLSQG